MKFSKVFLYTSSSFLILVNLVSSEIKPYPGDCTKYQLCDYSGCFVFSCGTGTEFNPKVNVCDYPLQGRGPCGSFETSIGGSGDTATCITCSNTNNIGSGSGNSSNNSPGLAKFSQNKGSGVTEHPETPRTCSSCLNKGVPSSEPENQTYTGNSNYGGGENSGNQASAHDSYSGNQAPRNSNHGSNSGGYHKNQDSIVGTHPENQGFSDSVYGKSQGPNGRVYSGNQGTAFDSYSGNQGPRVGAAGYLGNHGFSNVGYPVTQVSGTAANTENQGYITNNYGKNQADGANPQQGNFGSCTKCSNKEISSSQFSNGYAANQEPNSGAYPGKQTFAADSYTGTQRPRNVNHGSNTGKSATCTSCGNKIIPNIGFGGIGSIGYQGSSSSAYPGNQGVSDIGYPGNKSPGIPGYPGNKAVSTGTYPGNNSPGTTAYIGNHGLSTNIQRKPVTQEPSTGIYTGIKNSNGAAYPGSQASNGGVYSGSQGPSTGTYTGIKSPSGIAYQGSQGSNGEAHPGSKGTNSGAYSRNSGAARYPGSQGPSTISYSGNKNPSTTGYPKTHGSNTQGNQKPINSALGKKDGTISGTQGPFNGNSGQCRSCINQSKSTPGLVKSDNQGSATIGSGVRRNYGPFVSTKNHGLGGGAEHHNSGIDYANHGSFGSHSGSKNSHGSAVDFGSVNQHSYQEEDYEENEGEDDGNDGDSGLHVGPIKTSNPGSFSGNVAIPGTIKTSINSENNIC